jgi:hypothetical protein
VVEAGLAMGKKSEHAPCMTGRRQQSGDGVVVWASGAGWLDGLLLFFRLLLLSCRILLGPTRRDKSSLEKISKQVFKDFKK